MSTSALKYSPSINIIRDIDYSFGYIPTPNSIKVFDQLLTDSKAGNKCHLLIGAYGTGKSSLLLAYQQTLQGFDVHFKGRENLLKRSPAYHFVQIVGDNKSLLQYCAELFELEKLDYSTSDVIKAIDKRYKQLQKKSLGIAFVIDEFGKFLEFAAKNNPEVELYFIQQLCEWINGTSIQSVLIGTLHQDFTTYSFGLSKTQQDEWSKVKGRFNEIVFNEPVEQLLFLASEKINETFKNLKVDGNLDKLFTIIKESKAFPLKDYFNTTIANKLYPFDILSAAVLTLSLQRYGQNERSLFSFIESNDHLSLNSFDNSKQAYYSVDKVYDYLINNYYTLINQKISRSESLLWSTIRTAIERIEGVIRDENQVESQKLIKTIGLLNIFSSSAARLDKDFYIHYGKYSLGIKDVDSILEELERHKIIRFVKHSLKYVIFDGTDLDIDLAIDEAGRMIEKTTNLVEQLNQHFDFPFIAAKSVYYEKGTPRFFQFKLSEDPVADTPPEGEIDGFINLVFNEDPKVAVKIRQASANCEEAILYGYYKNSQKISNTLLEIQKIKKVISENLDDKVAVRELNGSKDHYTQLLNHYVFNSLYAADEVIEWYYRGARVQITGRQSFNQQLSTICNDVYSSTPTVSSELINKTKISGQVAVARKELMHRLLFNLHEEILGFPADKFPPEKSIYLSLLRHKGLHEKVDGIWTWQKPNDPSFTNLWTASEKFLESTKGKERSLFEFVEMLLSKPFKLKQGLVDFWVPIFLLSKADEYALFSDSGYIPSLNDDILDLINKKPDLFKIKAFDVEGIRLELFNRYRLLLSQSEQSKPTNKTFIQTIKPFLVFYKDLPEFAKRTKNLSKHTIALRELIASAKDPEKTFFEDFPTALGFSIQQIQTKKDGPTLFIQRLQESIKELRTAYNGLLERFELYISKEILGTSFSFPAYKTSFVDRYSGLKTHLLSPNHKAFLKSLVSPVDDKASWLNAVCLACMGKPLAALSDNDELVLYEKVSEYIFTLDNLSDISSAAPSDEEEDVLKLELTSFVEGIQHNLLRIPKEKTKEVLEIQRQIKPILGADKKISIAVLASLLKELLK